MQKKNTNLVWSPTHIYIQEQLRSGEELMMIVAPFIRENALASLVEECGSPEVLSVITRWTSRDIFSGISDLNIYPYLRDRGIPLYLNQAIHLKLLVFASNWAFVTSGNITGKGMGLSEPCNVEVGCQAELTTEDWHSIYNLLGTSFRVDDGIYQTATAYRDANSTPPGAIPDLILAPEENQDFSKLSLPATDSPSELHALYASREPIPVGRVAAFMHDIALYKVPSGLQEDAFYACLRESFKGQRFTQAIVRLIKETGTARFGLVNEWIQSKCSDKPTPYRWELKRNTRILYDWLEYFYDEITWDRPGHSQVIRWQEKP